MDRSWIKEGNRLSAEYTNGVNNFIDFAMLNSDNRRSLRCPCKNCCNLDFHTPEQIKVHLLKVGFLESYVVWTRHGEIEKPTSYRSSESPFLHEQRETEDMLGDIYEQLGNNSNRFRELVEDSEKPLYSGSNHSKLSGLMLLFNIKGKFGLSDQGFTALLEALSTLFPADNCIPKSMYEAKKVMKVLGLDYQKIHACRNDCILFHKQYTDLEKCPTCGESRWKEKKNGAISSAHRIPTKVLWYFPPIPRFKRMFQSPKTAENMTWHANHRIKDGKLRHPADSPAWHHIDKMWPNFSEESRNLRLALSSDGVNPHSSMSSSYSCWPVQMVIYNLPPWLTMKRKFMMLSLLISGPKQPGNDLDVYLEPLIDDLKTLWDDGVDVYDAFKNETFKMRAVLMWTISDFPAYGNLSGCTVKGYFACPVCGPKTSSTWLKCSKKCVYMSHRRFLPSDHKFRDLKKVFNNKVEREGPPETLTGQDVLKIVEEIDYFNLHEKMIDDGGEMPVQFGTSAAIPCPKKQSEEAMTRRSQYIADLLGVGLVGQITLIPYNSGDHWVLVAIDIAFGNVYYLDSLGDIPPFDLQVIVDQLSALLERNELYYVLIGCVCMSMLAHLISKLTISI
ncbi:unnamed protein product [Cuscuta epithymum]|uniref:Transposase-associated domain-containing protein n=1 Tax=Cuscuta epithymum TaxID=186058 RepID=A0AAV0D4M9_9ASTE|nr:unnamed protein product [Cuscuta epithymum]